MEYVFDARKDAANQLKHGVSWALAELLFAGKCTLLADDRLDYGEVRTLASGMIGVRLFV